MGSNDSKQLVSKSRSKKRSMLGKRTRRQASRVKNFLESKTQNSKSEFINHSTHQISDDSSFLADSRSVECTSDSEGSMDTGVMRKHYHRKILTNRCDVVYKTLVRDMRKHFLIDFNNFTEYNKKKRYRKPSYYQERVRHYIDTKFKGDETIPKGLDLEYYLGCMLYPKDMEKSLKD
jgi:hypothetical protein